MTVSGVTHKDLLLDAPVKLPILGVDMPLSRFFLFVPIGLLLVYAGLLLQHASLADKTRKLVFYCSDPG